MTDFSESVLELNRSNKQGRLGGALHIGQNMGPWRGTTPDGPVRLVGRRLKNNKDGKGPSSEFGECFCIVETLGGAQAQKRVPVVEAASKGGPDTTATIFGF